MEKDASRHTAPGEDDVRKRLLYSEMVAVVTLIACVTPYIVVSSRLDEEKSRLTMYLVAVAIATLMTVFTAPYPIARLTRPIRMFFDNLGREKMDRTLLLGARARALNLPTYFTLSVLSRYFAGALFIVMFMYLSGTLPVLDSIWLLLRGWLALIPGVVFLFFVCERIVQPVRQTIAQHCRGLEGTSPREKVLRVSLYARFLLVSLVLMALNLVALDLMNAIRVSDASLGRHISPSLAALVGWILFVAMILVLVISGLAARSISLPLRRAASIMESVGQGRLDLRVDVLTNDETASLGTSFNHMVDQLQESQLKLRRANEEILALNRDLEQKVADRTRAFRLEALKNTVVLQSIADGVMVFDSEQRVILANKAIENMLSLSQEELVGRHINDLVEAGTTPQDRDRSLALLVGMLMQVQEDDGTPVYLKFKLGDRTLSASLAPISEPVLDFSGGFVAVYRDITEEETAVELARLNKELVEANRLKNQFLATMSHELRTPLNSIIGYGQVLLRGIDGELNGEQSEDVRRIMQSGHNLLAIINDILDLSKIDAGRLDIRLAPVDVKKALVSAVQSVEPMARKKGLRVDVRIDELLPLVWADEDRLRQVLMNLLSNAVKFTREGGIRVEARDIGQAQVQVSVIDSGVGIAAADYKTIFDEFYQVDSSRTREFGGTGLGLAITKRLVELMGGLIWVESEVGRGSRFTFILSVYGVSEVSVEEPVPVFRDPEETSEESISPIERSLTPSTSRYRGIVLSVDDDPEVLDLMGRFLNEQGFHVIGARSITDGMRLARELDPVAITLDIFLPDGNGTDLLKQLKSDPATEHIPVLIVSVEDAREEVERLGAVAQLRKPVNRDMLVHEIRRTVARQARRQP